MEGLSKETVFTSWMAKFDCILKGTLRANFQFVFKKNVDEMCQKS